MNHHRLVRRSAAVVWLALAMTRPSGAAAQDQNQGEDQGPRIAHPPATAAPARATRAAPLVFDRVTVIDVRTGRRLPAQRVVVVGRRIRVVGPGHKVRVPLAAQVIDARGKYLIPGLWDMEAYVFGRPPEPLLGFLVATGVTGYRNLSEMVSMREEGGRYRVTIDSMLTWRRAITSGAWVGPRILIGGRPLEGCDLPQTDSRCTDQSGATMPEHISVPTPARARALVDSLHAAGADHIFVYNKFPMRREVIFAILAAARQRHIPVVGHLPDSVTLAEASDSGWHQVDHLMGTEGSCMRWWQPRDSLKEAPSIAKCTALAQRLRRNGIWLAAGPWYMVAYPQRMTRQEKERRLQYWPRQLRLKALQELDQVQWQSVTHVRQPEYLTLAERAGLPLLFATDLDALAAYPMGFQLHDDMATAVEHGLSPLTALQAATLNPARYLGGDSLGAVEAGKLADLVLLDADPLADIYNTQQIQAVVADGRYYDRAALDRLLEQSGAAEWR